MKILRRTVIAVFALSVCLFAVFYIMEMREDKTVPVLKVESEILDISLEAGDKEMLQGVTAYDEKDGDITSRIMIESISKFTEDGVAIVTYAVCDDDNHVVTAKRKIRYKDYTEPYFVVNKSLSFAVGEDIDLSSAISAYDCIDGDISDRVIITATDYETNKVGVFKISVKVTNSMGDTIYMDLPVYVEQKNIAAPEITLKEYLVHVKVGEEYDLYENIEGAKDKFGQPMTDVIIDTNYDPQKPGKYEAHYYTYDSKNREGHSILTIFVEEG